MNVVLIHPDGEEYDALLDETGSDLELRQDIVSALELEGSVEDYDINLIYGIKISEGSKIKIERKRKSKVALQPKGPLRGDVRK